MKKQLHLVSIFFFVFILHTGITAQCTYFSAVSDLTLHSTSFGPNKTGVAYNPNQNLYYSVIAGSAGYNIETFASTGGNPTSAATQGANYRGYWWNPTTSKPEGNSFSLTPVTTNSLNGLGIPTGVTGTVGLYGTPTGTAGQSAGVLNLNSTNQILYYDNNTLYRYSRLGGTFISSVTITGIPAGANINFYHLIYTGVPGSEVGLYDYTNRRVLFIDYTTGVYTNYCQLPTTAPNPSSYKFAYANNRVFLYDDTPGVDNWIGYPITGPLCPGESMQFSGGYAEKTQFSLGSSWTAEAWIKPTNASSAFWNTVLGQDYWFASGGQGFVIRVLNDSVGVECPTGGGASIYINAHATSGVWTHVAATYGNGILTFYKDGIFVGARAITTINNSTRPFHIGARNDNTGSSVIDGFNGSIDEVRIWNDVRSQCEIQTNMDAEIQGNAANLLANYHFNQGLASSTNTGITVLVDATTNISDCNFVNFGMTGSTNNFIQPGAVTSNNYNANPTPTGSITVKGNGNTIANNLAVTSATNNTDFGTAGIATRSFVITNTGAGSMKIGKPYMTGTNATEFTVTTSPSTLLLSTGSTTFVVTFSPTTAGVKSASVNIDINDCSKPIFKYLISATCTAAEAIDFDGVNDAIAIPNISLNNQSFTIEFWAKRSATNPANCYAVSQGSTGASFTSLQIGFPATNTFKFGFWNDDLNLASTACSDGQYHHWACVYNNTVTTGFNRFVYLDGQLLYAQRSFTAYSGTGTFYIGRNISAGGYFDGLLDEVRVWNTARTECEIQSYKNCEINTVPSGLIANYHFNQGVASGANGAQTNVSDATGGPHTGVLSGAALTGTTSNWVTPGGVTSGSTTPAAPTASVSITGNGNGITNGSTSASLTNFTDFGSVFTRTFVIDNTGGGTLNIDSVDIQGAGASRFSITSFPSRTITTGTTSLVVSFTPTSAVTETASISMITNDCSKPLFTFVLSGTGTSGAALAFAGSQTVTIPHSTAFNITAALSIEAWVKTTNAAEQYIITKNNDSWYLAISGGGGATGKASFYLNGLSPGGWLTGTSVISDGNWHHIAGTFDGTTMRLYVDGDLEAQIQQTGSIATGTSQVRLGSRDVTGLNFSGTMDEVRIWQAARSQCEIQRYMNCEIPTTTPSLVANYHFNQGLANSNNTGVNTLTSSAGGNTGTLSNFALTGSASNWVAPGGVVSSFSTVSTNTPSITVRGNGVAITDGTTTASAGDFTDFGSAATTRSFVISNGTSGTLTIGTPYFTGANAAEFAVTTLPSTSINPSGASTFVVTFNPTVAGTRTANISFVTNDCTKPVFNFVLSGTAIAGAALKFDGSNDYVRRTETNFSTGDFCVELWVKPASFSAPNGDIYLVTNRSNDFSGSGYWYVLGIESTGQLKLNMGTANLAAGFNLMAPASLTLNTWQHVAVSRTGTVLALYVNGVVVASGSDLGARDLNAGYNIVTFGAWGAPLGQRYFNGEMDDIRLWNTNRTQCQIQATMRAEITTTAGNLIGNYHFNQGVAGGNNTGQANLTDVSASAVNGVFTTFALTGANSNFVTPGGVTTGSTALAAITPSILVTGGTGTVVYGATGTNTTNFTNFNGVYTRTFVIDNVNTNTLNIGTPFLTGANASEFTVSALPAGAITTGTTSFVVAFTPTSSGTKTATVNFFNNDCSKPVFNFVIQAAGVTGSALDFSNASSDVISVPNVTLNNQSFSIEFWAKRSNINDDNYIVGQGTPSPNNALHIGFRNNNQFTFSFQTSDLNVSNPACTDGLYHHWACVYKSGVAGLNRLIYLDGRLIAADNASNYTGTGTFFIGNHTLGTPDYFNGSIDELRIWNSVRSQCDIQTYMNCEIATTSPSLTANFHFNQGVVMANNSTVNTLTDATATGHTGTLTSFALNGATSNWVATAGVNTGSFTTAVPAATITITGNGVGLSNGSTTPVLGNFTHFGSATTRTFVIDNTGGGTLNIDSVYFTGPDAAQFSKTSVLSPVTTGTLALVITYTPSAASQSATVNIFTNDCSKNVFNFAITATTSPGAALNFNGTDVVDCGTLPNLDITEGTWEAWVNMSNISQARRIIFKESADGTGVGTYELYYLNLSGKFQADIKIGATSYSVVSVTSPAINTWYHVAATYDDANGLKLYVNGNLEAANYTPTGSMNPGTGKVSIGGAVSNTVSNMMVGSIDEVRIWSAVRSQCEIQSYMNCEIPSTATGLVCNYHFNEGLSGANNSTATTLPDLAGADNNGTLTAFTLNGTTSNWVIPGGVSSGSVTPAAISSTMTVLGNGTVIANGAATPTVSNHTDFAATPSRTFTIDNTGTGTLNVGLPYLTGANASEFSVTLNPVANITTGTALFAIAFTPTASGTRTAMVNIPNNDCSKPTFSFVIQGSIPASAALNFDGANDNVYVNNNGLMSNFGVAPCAMEAWIYPTNITSPRSIIRKDGDYELFLTTGGFLQAYIYPGGSGGGALKLSVTTTPVVINQWSHVAAVWNGTIIALYINGLAVPTTTSSGASGSSSIMYIGYSFNFGQPFIGSIDEVRLWKTNRTHCEIQQYMNCELGPTPGLVANFHFNDAFANVTNTLTSITDYSGNSNTGFMNFFGLTGSTSNWIAPGGVNSGSVTPATLTSTLTVRGNAVTIAPGSVLTNTANWTDFNGTTSRTFSVTNTGTGTLNISPLVTLTGGDASSFSITTQPATLLTTGANSSFNVGFIPVTAGTKTAIVNVLSSDCSVPNYSFVITASISPGAALNFDGSNDLARRPVFSLANSNITMQVRVSLTAATATNQVILYNGNSSTSGYGFYATSTREIQILYGGSGIFPTGYILPLNQWKALSLVIEANKFVRFYVDGLQVFSTNPAGLPATPSGSFMVGSSTLGTENLNGSIDEVLFWTRALNQCEILTNIDSEIPVSSSSLVANYHFNQGLAGGNNPTVTTVTDATGNGNFLLLNNFAYTGSTSNWVAPGGVVSDYTVTSPPVSSTIAVTGNGNAIPNGSTGTSTLNNTNFNGVAQQTFAVANTGGALYVNNILFSGTNASDFSVTTAQSFSLGNGNSIVLGIAYTPTVVGTSTAIVTLKSSNCAVPDYSFVITASATPASALNLDGNDDHVIIAPGISSVIDPLNTITVEAWVYPTAATPNGPIIGNYATPTVAQLQFLLRQEVNAFSFYVNDGGSFKSVYTPTNIAVLNTWQHVVGQWDGSKLMIYVNGVLQGVTTGVTGSSFASTTNSVIIGYDSYSTPEKFLGSLDEIRVWTSVRTQCEIQSNMNCEIPTTAPGLLANYHFNQGLPSGLNTAVNTLTSATGSYNGTLANFNLSGSTSNWVSPGGVTSGSTTAVAITASITLSANSTSIISGAATSTANFTDFNGTLTRTFVITNTGIGTLNIGPPFLTGTNASEFSVTVMPATTLAANATSSFVVAFTPTASGVRSASVTIINNDCSKHIFNFAIQGTAPVAAALNFDGTNDLITIPYNAALSLNSSSFTIEFWAKPTVVDNNFHWVISKDNGNTSNDYQVGINSTNVWRFCGRNLGIDVYGTNTVIPGTLYHVAGVFDGATAKLYVNGILEAATNNVGTTIVNTSNILIGARTPTTPIQYFNGTIDELRIWNVARTQCDIQAYKNCEIPTSTPGLLANYHFNQGSAGLANPTTTVLADAAGTYTGALTSFSLNGAASNWVTPGGVISGSVTPAVIASPTFVISGNGNTITNGSTSTNTTNLTDFGTAPTRTFVIANTSTVTGNILFGSFTGANASSFSLSTLPSTVITAGGTTSFVVAFTPTAAGTYSALLIIKTSDCATPNYSFVITGTTTPAAALAFDGTTDFISAPGVALNNQPFTIEFWAKRNATTDYDIALSQGSISTNGGLHIGFQTGNFFMLGFYSNDLTVSHSDLLWHHWACVYKTGVATGSKNRFIYRDGVLIASDYSASTYTGTGVMQIGKTIFSTDYFNGSLDEMRIWNVARTQCEIQQYMSCEIPTTSPNLLTNYHFNQGAAGLANPTITTLIDAAGANTGTLNTFALTGTLSNWVSPGGVNSGSVTPAVIASPTLLVSGNGNTIANGNVATGTNDFTDFGGNSTRTFSAQNTSTVSLNVFGVQLSGANAASFSVTTQPSTLITAGGSSTFAVAYTPTAIGTHTAIVTVSSADCNVPTYSFVITSSVTASSALAFDGTNDHVAAPNIAALNMNNALSVEVWVKPGGISGIQYVVTKETSDLGNGQYGIVLINGVPQFHMYNSGHASVAANYTLTPGVWIHLAGTWDGATIRIYLNGVLYGTAPYATPLPASTGSLVIGSINTISYMYRGAIDELRIWNTARTQCEIQSYMNAETTSTLTGLVANYHFNQGIPSGSNLSVTTLTDSSVNNNTGTLNTFNLTLGNSISNWVSPGGIANDYTITTVPVATLIVTGNSTTITAGSTLTGTNNFTDFGAAATRTFVAKNAASATSTLYINTITLSGANAADFSVTTLPAASLTASGNSNIVISFTPTAVGTRSAIVNISSSDCTSPNYSFVITGSVSAASALAFDGLSDYVSTASLAALGMTNTATMEGWFKTSSSSLQEVSSLGNAGGTGFEIQISSGTFGFNAYLGGWNNFTSGPVVNDGNWHHYAVVTSGNTARGYLDGNYLGSITGTAPINSGNSILHIGKHPSAGAFFNGSMDETRVWNTARTQCEIQQYMNCEIPSTAPGLVVNYHFNQGIPSGSNLSVTTLTDAASGINGTLNTFALTGSTSNWISPGGVISGSIIPASITSSIGLTGNGFVINNNATGTATNNLTDYNGASTRTFVVTNTGTGTLNVGMPYLSGLNASEFSVTVLPAPSTLTAGATTSFVVVFTPTAGGLRTATVNITSNDCNKPLFNFTIKGSPPLAEALGFDGSGSYVDLGAGAALKPTAALTAEAWVFSSTWSSADKTILGNTESSGYGIFTKASGQLEGLVHRNSTFASVTTPLAGLTAGWHHVALTYNGQLTALYVDGVLKSLDNAGAVYPVDYIGNNTLIGAEASSGASPIAGWYFNGKVDEVRVWNAARTQCEIQSYMGAEIPAGATNLVANYHFNQGSAGLNNASVTNLTDAAGVNTGTLNGFALTGTVSNWVAPGGVASGNTAVATPSAEINILGNNVTINDNSTTPSLSDDTNFGNSCTNTSVTKTFTVQNTGTTVLTVAAITVTGTDASAFAINGSSTTIAAGGNATFAVTFTSTVVGVKNATIQVISNDCDESLYDFAITGTVNARPFLSTTNPFICQGQSYTLSATGANTYTYSSGPVVSPFSTTSYSITGTSTAGCVSSNTAVSQIFVNAIPPVTIAGSNTICFGGSTSFTASNANTYTWSTGATGTVISLSPTVTTTYTVTGAYANGCANTAVVTLSVHPSPTVTVNSGTICPGQSFTITPSGASTYSYANGGPVVNPTVTTSYSVTGTSSLGCNSSPASISIVSVVPVPTVNISNYSICSGSSVTLSPTGAVGYTYAGGSAIVSPTTTTSYTVAGANASGCVNTATSIVTVNSAPVLTISASSASICIGAATTLTATGASTYLWSNGLTTQTISVSPAANITYSVTGTDVNGCVGTASQNIVVNPLPTITIPNGAICPGNSYTLVPSGASTYTFSSGSNVINPVITGTYAVIGTSSLGCVASSSAIATVSVINTVTVAVTGNTTICEGSTTTLTASGATSYSWSNGALTASVALSPTVNTTYTVYGVSGTCSNTAVVSVSVNAAPSITVNSGAICLGSSFTMTPTGATSYTYSSVSAIVSPVTTTSYSVAGTNAIGCVSTASAISTVTVNSVPTLTIAATNNTICENGSTTLTASGATSYTWSNGLQTPSISVSPTANTTYTVSGTNVNGCISFTTQTITVNPLPTITIPNGAICPGNSYTLVPSGASTYTFSSGTNVVSPPSVGVYTYAVLGTSSLGCVASASAIATVSVVNTLSISVTGNTTICEGTTATLTALGASTYSWSNGALTSTVALLPTVNTTYTVYGASGSCSNNAVVSVSVNAAPSITVNSGAICAGDSFTMTPGGAVSYTYSSGSNIVSPVTTTSYAVAGTNAIGCVSTVSAISTVTVNALPTLTITAPSASICTGSTTTLTASGATTYTWSNTLQTTSISVSPTANTTYTVSGTNAIGCIGSTSQLIAVNSLPTITIPNGAVCPGNSYTLVPSDASTYTFSSGSNVINPVITGTYAVIGTSSLGCVASSSAIATVSVINTVTVAVTGNTTICEGVTTTLTASGATSYSWSNSALTASVVLSPTVNTTYTVYGVSGTCSNTAVVSVSVNAAPSITVNSGAICAGGSFTMTPSGASSYTYSSGSNSVTPVTNTSYSVSGTNAIGCVSTVSAISTVTVNALPTLTITAPSASICTGATTTLTASGATTYTWSNTLQTSSISVSPTANTTYTASGTGTNGCIGSTSQLIAINPLPTITIANGAICPGNSYTLVPSGASTYTFSSGTDVVSPPAVGVYTYAVLGTSSLGCVASASAIATVSVVNTLSISVTGNTTICEGTAATLTALGASTYSWSNGTLTASVVVSPTINTTYTVYGASGTCSNTAIVSVSVNAAPTITVNSGAICAGSSFTMTPGGAVSYTYSSGSTSVSPVTTTSYSVAGTNALGCVSTVSAISTVTVNALPTLTIAAINNTICTGATTTLTASGATTYTWSNTLQTSSISVSPTANITYSVNGTGANGCIGSTSQLIAVNPLPTITIPNGAICPGNTYTLVPSGASTYTFSSGTDVVSPPAVGVYTYAVIGTSSLGCVASSSAIATVSVVNTLSISVTGNTTICEGVTTTLTANGATTYSWSNGILTSSVVLSPTVNTTYTVYGSSGTCSNTAVVSVSVNAAPTITVNSGFVCSGSSFTMTPGGAVSYTYSSGSAIVSPLTNTSYSVSGTNALGCVSTASAISNVTVNALPTPTITATNYTVCSGETTTLTLTGVTSYTWNNNLQTNTIAVAPVSNTTYSVLGTGTNGCVSSASQAIVVNPLPTITVPNGAICPGNSFTLTPSGAATYSYSSGSNVVNPSVIGTYTYAILGTSSLGCVASASAIATVSVINSLTITVTGNTTICTGQTATLTAGGAATYSWSTGITTDSITLSPATNTTYTVYGVSGTCSNSAMVQVSVNAVPTITVNSGAICSGQSFTMIPGGAVTYTYSSGSAIVNPLTNTSYSVSGTNAAGCVSTASAIANVVVNASPTLAIASTTAVCEGSPVTLTVSGAATYSWSNTLTTNTITVTPLVNNNYSVIGTSANGCSATASQSIHIDPLPTITVNGGAVCPGGSFTLNPQGAATYSFSSGSNVVSPSVIGTHTYGISGTSAAGCVATNSAIATVSVVNTLTLTITGNTTICTGQQASLTVGGASTYSWSTGVTTDSITLSPTANTSYTVYGYSGSCIDKALVTVSVNALPTVSVSGGTVCSASGFTLVPSGALTYSYSGGSAIVNPTVNTSYSVTGIDVNGCVSSNTAIAEVTVIALPSITVAITNPSVCAGQTTSLSAGGATAYVWSDAQTSATIAITPSTTILYTVTGTDGNGCQNTASVTAFVSPGASLTVSGSSVICAGTTANLSVSGASTYTWNSGETSNTLVVTPSVTTSYSVTGSIAGSCDATVVTTISVSAMPTLTLSGADSVCVNSSIVLGVSGASTYSWSTGETSPVISVAPSLTSSYTVMGTNSVGCSATSTVEIAVKNCVKHPLELVNAVTPNSDGLNDTWIIKNIQEYPKNKVVVFNRWGIEVYSVTGYNNDDKVWPAKGETTNLTASTYFYIIDLKDGSKPIKGWVELIKD